MDEVDLEVHDGIGLPAHTRSERLERGLDPELVQRRWPEIGDQRPQVSNAGLEMFDRVTHRGLQPVVVTTPKGTREQDPQRGQLLQRLVVQLTRPAAALPF